jgi:hypothetical protein
MPLISPPKNVFDATIGDGKIVASRKGQLAMASPEVLRYFTRIKEELWRAKIAGYEISAADRSRDVNVSVKMHVEFNGKGYTQKLQLSTAGDYKPQAPHDPIDIAKDPESKKLSHRIAEESRRITGQANWAYTKSGNPIPPEDVVLGQMKTMLKTEIKDANTRLTNEMKILLTSESFRLEAQREYEDVVRDRVHEALEDFSKVSPETMHKFVDELYCKKIHDS